MKNKDGVKVFLHRRDVLEIPGGARRLLHIAPWLISAAAAWLTFFPCSTALAAP